MEEINWAKYGFTNTEFFPNIYERDGFPFEMGEDHGFLDVHYNFFEEEGHIIISEGKIPATNQSVVLLLKAFNCSKLP